MTGDHPVVAWGWARGRGRGGNSKGIAGRGGALGVMEVSRTLIVVMGVKISLNHPNSAGDVVQLIEPSMQCPGFYLQSY